MVPLTAPVSNILCRVQAIPDTDSTSSLHSAPRPTPFHTPFSMCSSSPNPHMRATLSTRPTTSRSLATRRPPIFSIRPSATRTQATPYTRNNLQGCILRVSTRTTPTQPPHTRSTRPPRPATVAPGGTSPRSPLSTRRLITHRHSTRRATLGIPSTSRRPHSSTPRAANTSLPARRRRTRARRHRHRRPHHHLFHPAARSPSCAARTTPTHLRTALNGPCGWGMSPAMRHTTSSGAS